jgi:hypothetical protein
LAGTIVVNVTQVMDFQQQSAESIFWIAVPVSRRGAKVGNLGRFLRWQHITTAAGGRKLGQGASAELGSGDGSVPFSFASSAGLTEVVAASSES